MKQRPCRQCRTPFAVVNGGQRYCTTCQGKRTTQAEDTAQRARYDALFAALPAEQKAMHCAVLLVGLLGAIKQKNEEIHPEEIAHDNQPAIDATFYQLMGDITL